MIQGFDPRTGEPLGEPVAETTDAGLDAIVAQHHGALWPATTMPAYTSVGTAAIRRWLVLVAYQNVPPGLARG